MNLSNIRTLADADYVAETKGELNKKYIASSDIIITDGKTFHHINNDGYIDIEKVESANYIIFADQNGNIFLGIYRYIAEQKFKDVVDGINSIRAQLGMHKHSSKPVRDNISEYYGYQKQTKETVKKKEPSRSKDKILKLEPSEVVNINNLTCPECGSTNFEEPYLYDDASNITCQCVECRTKLFLIPSKYYVIKSITKYTDISSNVVTKSITKHTTKK